MLAAVAAALKGGRLTREALAAAVAERVGDETLVEKLGGGFGDLLKPAAFTGDLCFAPSDGRRVRFTRPSSWLEGFRPPGPDEAASLELLRSYLRAYGPAPREQFQRWFGMTSPAEAGRWIKTLGTEVAEVDVEGARGWMLDADVGAAAAAEPTGAVRLLPAFDHYVVAAPRDAGAVLPASHRARVYRPQAGSHRCCWSTAAWPASGRTRSKATGSRSRSSRSPASTAGFAHERRRRPSGSPPSSEAG